MGTVIQERQLDHSLSNTRFMNNANFKIKKSNHGTYLTQWSYILCSDISSLHTHLPVLCLVYLFFCIYIEVLFWLTNGNVYTINMFWYILTCVLMETGREIRQGFDRNSERLNAFNSIRYTHLYSLAKSHNYTKKMMNIDMWSSVYISWPCY